MKIVVDTNVVISGVFFGGNPRQIIEAIVNGDIKAYATTKILDEYMGIIESMIERKQGRLNQSILSPFFLSLKMIESDTNIEVCRDPDDDNSLNVLWMQKHCTLLVAIMIY